MTPAAIIRHAGAEGVSLALSAAGTIRATGNAEAVKRWLPTIRENKPGILAELVRDPELFAFAPPADPENNAEAIEERAAIISEGCGMDLAQALQEARWHVERERTWRVFLRNAQRILEAPETARAALLERYRAAAANRYGETVAQSMARTMAGWIAARET